MKQYKFKSKQRGLVGVVFLVIALLVVVLGAMAIMSRSSTSGVGDQGAKTNAAVILKQGADFKAGFDRLLVSGTVTAAQITFDTTTSTGLFDPLAGYAIVQTPPAVSQTVVSPYTYSKLVTLQGIGTMAAEQVLTLGNVTLAVCQQINKTLYNDSPTATPSPSTGSTAAWTSAPAAIADGTAGRTGRNEACVGTSDASYVYYKALQEI